MSLVLKLPAGPDLDMVGSIFNRGGSCFHHNVTRKTQTHTNPLSPEQNAPSVSERLAAQQEAAQQEAARDVRRINPDDQFLLRRRAQTVSEMTTSALVRPPGGGVDQDRSGPVSEQI